MKLVFNLLDASYEVRGGKPQVILWGVAEDGRRVVVIDEGFRPYFYVLPESEDLIPAISQRLRMLSKPKSPIVGLDAVEHKYFGRRVKVIRVTTVIPEYVRTYREEAAKIPGVREVLEADIRFVMRYMIDNNIRPFAWHEVEVEEAEEKGYRVGAVYRALERPRLVDREGIPQLRVLAFDIEVYAPTGSPKHGRDPVIIISTMNSEGEVRQFVAEDMDDGEVIKGFVEYVKSYDPDIIVGYNSNKFDWPYLKDRAKVLGIKLDLSRRVGVEPTTSVYGHISVAGRLNVDLYDYAEEIPEIKVKTLENVAEYLGVMKKEERVEIPWYEIPKYWENPEFRDKLLQYAQDDVVATYGIAEKILPFAIQLAYITGLPLDQVGAASVGFRLEWYLMREAYRLGELVPNRVERPPLTYKGAIVLEPRKGVHEDIAVLDFSSMYPNIMIRYNVGPDTLLRRGEEEPPEGVWIAPEVGHRFRKAPPGFFKTVLETLLELRKRLREQMKKYEPGTPEYRLLDNRQKAVKVLANAAYGYQGWTVARWYCRECAEAVTAWGRQTIMGALKIAGELGLEVIYGDSVSGDTKVLVRKDGKIRVVRISELFEGKPDLVTPDGKEYKFLRNIETLTLDEDGNLTWKPVKYVMRHKCGKTMYRVWLTNKWYVDVTEDHSLIGYVNVLNRRRISTEKTGLTLVKPIDLKKHVKSLVVPNAPVVENLEASETEVKMWEFIGLAIGDGSYGWRGSSGKYYIQLSLGKDKDEIEKKLLEPLRKAGIITNWYEKNGKGDVTVLSKKLAGILRNFKNGKGKVIPDFVLNLPGPLIKAFLRGYFTADGTVILRNGRPIVRLTTTNEELAEAVRALLFAVGISNSVFEEKSPNRYLGKVSTTYSKHIVVKDVVKFAREIGFLSDRKNERLKGARYGLEKTNVKTMGFDLQRVQRIERIAYNGYVYDLEVEDTHRFFANWVLVHNTDSLFVRHEPGTVEKFIKLVEERLGFDIKIDKVYRRVFFTEAKKRYIGLLKDGRIDIVGFEAVRGDWAEIAKEVQEKVAEIVLREGDVEKAIEYVKSLIEELKAGKVPLEKLVIWKTLTKSIKEYSVEAPHVAAAKRMKEKGYTVEVGDKVGYVIVKGGGTLSSRAYPYFLAKPSDIDSNYYVDHQVIPAALRILGYYGVTEARLKALSRGQKSLFDFF